MSSDNPAISSKRYDSQLGDTLVFFAFIVGILFFFLVMGYQSFVWLKTGVWPPLNLYHGFQYFNIDLSFIFYPRDWVGIAKISAWFLKLPLSMGAPFLLLIICNILKLGLNEKRVPNTTLSSP